MAGMLQSMGFRNVRGEYFLALEERTQASWVTQVASYLTTDQPVELIKWLGNAPNMQKWAGERRRQELQDYGIQVMNDKFEATIEVDIDDWRRDKTGQIIARVRDLAAKAATLPQRVLTTMLIGNGNGYDGLPFFSASHVVGESGTVSNALTITGVSTPAAPTTAQMSSAILTAIQQLYTIRDDRGDPMNGEASNFAVMVPVHFWAVTAGALKNEYTSSGVSNTLISAGVNIQSFVNPRLPSNANTFYVFRTDANVRALLWQDENLPDSFKALDEMSENGFWRDSIAFGAKRIGQGAFGRWELACRASLTT